MLLNIDRAVGLPDAVACAAGVCGCIDGSSVTESNDDSSGKNVFIAEPLPPLKLQLAAVFGGVFDINLLTYFLRGDSANEPECFGEQSRDDDDILVSFYLNIFKKLYFEEDDIY